MVAPWGLWGRLRRAGGKAAAFGGRAPFVGDAPPARCVRSFRRVRARRLALGFWGSVAGGAPPAPPFFAPEFYLLRARHALVVLTVVWDAPLGVCFNMEIRVIRLIFGLRVRCPLYAKNALGLRPRC